MQREAEAFLSGSAAPKAPDVRPGGGGGGGGGGWGGLGGGLLGCPFFRLVGVTL